MKTTRLLAIAFIATSTFISCQKSFTEDSVSNNKVNTDVAVESISNNITTTTNAVTTPGTTTATGGMTTEAAGPCNSNAYTITLESHTQLADGNWEWIWSVQNPNPGNGNNGTSQNLSHWGMEFGTCFQWADVSSAAYSMNGTSWTGFTPNYAVDPSQSCKTTPVLKFDYGTVSSAKTYYKLVLTYNYAVGISNGYYKSGSRTGCCTFTFSGIGCDQGENPR